MSVCTHICTGAYVCAREQKSGGAGNPFLCVQSFLRQSFPLNPRPAFCRLGQQARVIFLVCVCPLRAGTWWSRLHSMPSGRADSLSLSTIFFKQQIILVPPSTGISLSFLFPPSLCPFFVSFEAGISRTGLDLTAAPISLRRASPQSGHCWQFHTALVISSFEHTTFCAFPTLSTGMLWAELHIFSDSC